MNKFRFKTRINIAFALLSFTLIISGFTLYRMDDLKHNIEEFYNHPYMVSNSVGNLKEKISNINHWTDHYIKSDSEEKKTLYKIIKIDDSIAYEAIEDIEKHYLGNQSDIDSLKKHYINYSKLINSVIDLNNGKDASINDSLLHEFEILKLNQLLIQTETISNFAQNKADSLYIKAIEKDEKRIKFFSIAIGFIIVLILLLSYTISKSITNPVTKFVKDLKALYANDNTIKLEDLKKANEEEVFSKTVNELKEAYQKLDSFNLNLEQKVKLRTKELKESERKFKDLFEKSTDALLIIRNELFVDCNEASIKMLGYSSIDDILQKHPSELSPPKQPDGRDSLENANEKMNTAYSKGSLRFEWIHKRNNGEEFPVEVLLTAISNNPNERIIYCVLRDITKRKEAELELLRAKKEAERSKDYLENIINKVGDPVFVKDEKSNYVIVNDAFCKSFKLSREELIANSKIKNIKNEENETYWRIDKQVLSTGEENINEETMTLKGEEPKVILTRKTRYIDEQGNKFLIGVIKDISVMKQTELELIKAKELAEEGERLKSAFLSNMSHEIRTPLNAILGFVSLLGEKKVNHQKKSKYIELINDAGNRLLNIISDVLDVSKIDSKQLTINLSVYNLNEIIDNVFAQFSIQFKSNDVVLKCSKTLNDEDSFIKTDKNRLFQVLSNLIENALKFTKKGYVGFGYTIEHNMIQFFVEDTGIGINEKDRDIIFERFNQGSNDYSKTGSGNGLGLTIAKGIVELLGGSIWLDTTFKKGTRFVFTIPYLHSNLKDIEVIPEYTKENSNIMNTNITVLVAEDEITNFIYLREVLRPFKFKILHANNGEEAVQLFKKNERDINLVLMDVKMPVMDGYVATSEIRKVNTKIPIIAITAYTLADEEYRALKAGCNQYLSKPVSKFTLYELIFKYLKVKLDS